MLVLFETPAGFALFQVDEGKVQDVDNLYKKFQDVSSAKKIVSLKSFKKFEGGTQEALTTATSLLESKMSSSLKKFLKKNIVDQDVKAKLAVVDKKLGKDIKDKLNIECVNDKNVMELFRCIRFQLNDLMSDNLDQKTMEAMSLGLSHSLGRYKLRFSPDKVDVMIIQAISLLDDLDKEINTYAMRVKEWYGWHFPELAKILNENIVYAKLVKKLGSRQNMENVDLTDILEEEMLFKVKSAAKISVGSEISAEDIQNVMELCDQVLESNTYREQLSEYIKQRMRAIAPNLTVLVGELVGAKLIARAGSLVNLAKHPASTVQIIGAEKALFRALKAKKNTPKYGIIYNASLVGHATLKNKGKVSRVLANKTVLSARVDALGDEKTKPIGMENLEKIKTKLKQLEGEQLKIDEPVILNQKYDAPTNVTSYNASDDIVMGGADDEAEGNGDEKKSKKRKRKSSKKGTTEETEDQVITKEDEAPVKKRKKNKKKKADDEEEN